MYAAEAVIAVLKKYRKAEASIELAEIADLFADASEDLLLVMSERDVEIAEIAGQYFDEKEEVNS